MNNIYSLSFIGQRLSALVLHVGFPWQRYFLVTINALIKLLPCPILNNLSSYPSAFVC